MEPEKESTTIDAIISLLECESLHINEGHGVSGFIQLFKESC